jgi:hypothetical protein
MKRRVWKGALWALMLGLVGLLAAGCYTVLVHPEVQMTGEDNSAKMCSDCHSSADYYYWHYPYQYNWYSRNPHWSNYYNNPWWWDNYWYWDDHDHGGGGETPRAPGGHLWQPRNPPATGGEPVIAPGTSGNTKDSGKSSGQGGDQGGSDSDKSDKGHLFQPRVPPKDSGSDNQQNSDKPDDTKKSDDAADKKAEDQK